MNGWNPTPNTDDENPKDTDFDRNSPHHTLGSNPNQAAPGNHGHSDLSPVGHGHSDLTNAISNLQSQLDGNTWVTEDELTQERTEIDNYISTQVTNLHAELDTKAKYFPVSPNPPDGTENNAGDIWEQHAPGYPNRIIGRWRGLGGTSWQPLSLDATFIPYLDAAHITTGSFDADRIGAKTIGVSKLVVTDMTNYATLREDTAGSVEYGWTSTSVGGWAGRSSNSVNPYFMFNKDDSAPPFKTGDWINVEFEAYASTNVTASLNLWIYGAPSNTSQTIGSVGLTTGAQSFAYPVQVTVDTNGKHSWLIGLAGLLNQNVFVRNVRIRRMNGGNLIVDGAITADKLNVNDINAAQTIVVGIPQVTGLSGELTDIDTAITDAENNAKSYADTNYSGTKTRVNGWTKTGTTLIDGGNIYADSVTAVQIDADAITAEHIDSQTLIGVTIKTASAGKRIEIDGPGNDVRIYHSDTGSNYGGIETSGWFEGGLPSQQGTDTYILGAAYTTRYGNGQPQIRLRASKSGVATVYMNCPTKVNSYIEATGEVSGSSFKTSVGNSITGMACGRESGTTDSNAQFQVVHNLGNSNHSLVLTNESGTAVTRIFKVISRGTNTDTVQMDNAAGTAMPNSTYTAHWIAMRG